MSSGGRIELRFYPDPEMNLLNPWSYHRAKYPHCDMGQFTGRSFSLIPRPMPRLGFCVLYDWAPVAGDWLLYILICAICISLSSIFDLPTWGISDCLCRRTEITRLISTPILPPYPLWLSRFSVEIPISCTTPFRWIGPFGFSRCLHPPPTSYPDIRWMI